MKLDRDINKLDPNFLKKVKLLLSLCPQIFVTCATRTAEEQNWLYINKPGSTDKDGYIKKSQHQLGLAIDIAFNGPELYPISHQKWREVADIAKKCGINWGYDLWFLKYGFSDKPHLQCDGTKFNQNKMPNTDYIEMSQALEKQLLTDLSGEGTMTEGQIKGLLNVLADRVIKEVMKQISDKLTK